MFLLAMCLPPVDVGCRPLQGWLTYACSSQGLPAIMRVVASKSKLKRPGLANRGTDSKMVGRRSIGDSAVSWRIPIIATCFCCDRGDVQTPHLGQLPPFPRKNVAPLRKEDPPKNWLAPSPKLPQQHALLSAPTAGPVGSSCWPPTRSRTRRSTPSSPHWRSTPA